MIGDPEQDGWERCPNCNGRMQVRSIERIEAGVDIELSQDDDSGALARAEWAGETTLFWDTSTTLRYETTCCGEVLPEAYQVALDERLGNSRVQEPSS